MEILQAATGSPAVASVRDAAGAPSLAVWRGSESNTSPSASARALSAAISRSMSSAS